MQIPHPLKTFLTSVILPPSLQFNSILILPYNTTLSKLGPNSVQSGESSIEVEGSGQIITIISREFSLQGEEDEIKCFCFQQERLDGLSVPATADRYIYIFMFISLFSHSNPPSSPFLVTNIKRGGKILIRNVEKRQGNQGCWGEGRRELCLSQVCFPSAFFYTR